jgi:hypothetical protein
MPEQIAEKLKTSFEALQADGGETCWYKPGKVQRVPFFTKLPEAADVAYILRPGDEDITEERSSNGGAAEHEFFLVVAAKHERGTDDPDEEQEPRRWTVVNRLVRDAVRCLLSNVTLDGLVANVDSTSISVDREQYLENWAMAELRFTVSYRFDGGAP